MYFFNRWEENQNRIGSIKILMQIQRKKNTQKQNQNRIVSFKIMQNKNNKINKINALIII